MPNLRLHMKLFLIGMLFVSSVSYNLFSIETEIYSGLHLVRGAEYNFQLIWQNNTNQTFSTDWSSEINSQNWEVGEDMILIDDQLYITSTLYGIDSVVLP